MTRSGKAGIGVAVALLVLFAGCAGFANDVDEERLGEDADYEWNQSADATYDVQPDEMKAVVRVEDTGEVELWQPGDLGGESPLPVSAIKFRYPNGTVVGVEAFAVEKTNDALILGLPADNGTLAYTVESGSRSAFVPVVGTGSHEVILPPGMRTDVPVFGDVEPGDYKKTRQDNRVHFTWSAAPDRPIYIQYYLQRDLYIFGGAVAVFSVLGAIGLVYFRIKIRRLERQRKEAGLDLEK